MKKPNKSKTPKHKQKKESKLTISPSRRKLYFFITILLPLMFFVILEFSLRIFNYGDYPKLFVPTPDENSKYLGINLNIGTRYFYWSHFNPSPRKDLFLKEKPANGYRIFVLGGSTTAGFPYGNNITFPRILNRRLSDTFPGKRIEVINTAMTAINSYTILDFVDEILEQKPDAILIYAGHNEYYGALGVGSNESFGNNQTIVRIYLKLQKFKTFLLLRDVIRWLYNLFGSNSDELMNDPTGTEMSRIVKDQSIPFGGSLYESGKEQFQNNLKSILQTFKDAGVPVIISELVSNIRDQNPFISNEKDSVLSAKRFYSEAQLLERIGKYEQAKDDYYKAKDLDELRFRAPEEFNDIIHRLANEFSIPVVLMKLYFESASPNGLIGNSLMNEHLHPKINGYFLMADAFFNMMRKENFISSNWQEKNIKPIEYYRYNWGYTSLDSVSASLTINHLKDGWPFKPEGPNLFFSTYIPKTKEESIALNILKTGSSTLELGHIELSHFYEANKNYEKAFLENKALIYTVPNLDLFYESALNILLTTQQYQRALLLMEDALKFNESGFVYKWLGQLHLALGETQEGIIALGKAKNMVPNDTQALYNLVRAYYNTSQFNKGDAALALLKKTNVNPSVINELLSLKKSISEQKINK